MKINYEDMAGYGCMAGFRTLLGKTGNLAARVEIFVTYPPKYTKTKTRLGQFRKVAKNRRINSD